MKKHVLLHTLIISVILAAFSTVVMFLWNALLPDIFGFVNISFWQAAGLLILARILFGGIGGHRRFVDRKMMFGKNPIHEKWKKMTPEERSEFISKRNKFHHFMQHPFDVNDSIKEDEK